MENIRHKYFFALQKYLSLTLHFVREQNEPGGTLIFFSTKYINVPEVVRDGSQCHTV